MSNLFSGINLAYQAMLAQQQAMEITEHNVANANTPGFRRQGVMLSAGLPYGRITLMGEGGIGQMGSGVLVEKIQRFSIGFFDRRYRLEASEARRWSVQSDSLKQLEAAMGETSSGGLLPIMDQFYASWRTLADAPSNPSARALVREQASTLVSAFNHRSARIDTLIADQRQGLAQGVDEFNDLIAQVAHLNGEISRVLSTGQQPNDLLDQRDRLLDRLSELGGIQSFLQPNGEVMVSIGGHNVVTGRESFNIGYLTQVNAADPTRIDLILTAPGGNPFTPPSGELAGIIDIHNGYLQDQKAGLNTLAKALADKVNEIHRGGYSPNYVGGADGMNFFTINTGTGETLTDTGNIAFTAANIRVSSAILSDLNHLAFSDAANPADADGNIRGVPAGNGGNAAKIAALQSTALAALGNVTTGQYYNHQATAFGLAVKRAGNEAEDHALAVETLSDQRESVSGVNLDEEAANMVKYQRVYEAVSRVATVLDEMLDRVINGMGLVGRS